MRNGKNVPACFWLDSAALGRTACDDVYCQTFSAAGIKIYTLILIDNSFSIPENNRTAIQMELLEWIAARRRDEAFAVGTVSDQVYVIRDFTDDYVQLKETIETIEYRNQETYLTDALYDYLSFLQSGDSGIQITSFYFDKDAYLAGRETDFLVSVAYHCPEDEVCILMIGANTREPNSFAMMNEDYQVTGSGGYQFHISVTPVQWEEANFGIYVNLSGANHGDTWTPFAMDVLYIDLEGNTFGFR